MIFKKIDGYEEIEFWNEIICNLINFNEIY